MKQAHVDSNGQILGWYDPEIHNSIPEPSIQVTEEVWQNAINNSHNTIIDGVTSQVDHRSDEQKAKDARTQRNMLLTTIVDPIVTNPLRWAELSTTEQQEWADYRTALLNVPQQVGFPNSVTWPIQP